ncbi:MAG TPA: hypothetical protein VGG05_04400 [Pseudonocardiaceae bacterium]|jgi:hypothetical protein
MSLDDALTTWAAAVRLPDAAAEDIYARIIATPAPRQLGARWWRDYTSGFTARMVASTRPVRWAA